MKELTEHQVCVLLSLSIISIKFIVFPALYAKFAYQNMYWCAVFSSIIDLFFLGITLWFLKRNPDKTLKEILLENFGKVLTKIIYFILFVYFFAKSVLILKETHNFFLSNLFDEINWFFFIFPFLLLISYMMYKTIRTIGRTVEIFYVLIAIGLILGLIIPLTNFKLDNILPFLNNGLNPVFSGVFKGNFSYGDYLTIIMLLGKFKVTEKTSSKIFKYWSLTTILVIVFYLTYAGVFNVMGLTQNPAISKLPLNASFPATVSRLDWVTIIIWTILLIFQTGVYMIFCLESFINFTSVTNKSVGIFIVITLLFVSALALYLNLELSVKIVTSNVFAIITILMQVSIPLLLLLSEMIKKRRCNNNDLIKKSVKE